MVGDDVNQSYGAFKIVPPVPKSLVDSKELLVMGVVVELWSRQSPGIVGNRPGLLIRTMNGENTSNGIVGSACLYSDWSVWCQSPLILVWRRMVPEAYFEALVVMAKGLEKSERWRTGHDRKSFFSSLKDY